MLADVANRPAFLDHFTGDYNLLRIRSEGVGAGARFRVDVPLRTMWMETVIDRLDPPYRIDERGSTGRGGRIPARTVFELVETGDGMTQVTVTFWTSPEHWWDRVRDMVALGQARWWRRRWRRGLDRLREIVESEQPVPGRLRAAGGNPSLTGVP